MEKIYNSFPVMIKERMGLPNTYVLLNQDQQDFVDSFDIWTNIDRDQVKGCIGNLKKTVTNLELEIDFLTEHFLGEE